MKKLGLDATDIRILSAIQRHGQLSKTRLSEIVNISPTPCWARFDRLKAGGFIRGYSADIALERFCDFTQVMVTVSLTHHRKADFDRLLSASTEQLKEKLREDLRRNPDDVQLWPSPDIYRDELSIPASDIPHACTHWTREGLAVRRGDREGIQPVLAIARVFVRRFRASRSQPQLPRLRQ